MAWEEVTEVLHVEDTLQDDSKRSPHWLETETPAPMTRALAIVKSRSWRATGATIRTVKRRPPTLPSTVLFGLRVGNSRLRPNKRPAKYAPSRRSRAHHRYEDEDDAVSGAGKQPPEAPAGRRPRAT